MGCPHECVCWRWAPAEPYYTVGYKASGIMGIVEDFARTAELTKNKWVIDFRGGDVGGLVDSTVASEQEGPRFKSRVSLRVLPVSVAFLWVIPQFKNMHV